MMVRTELMEPAASTGGIELLVAIAAEPTLAHRVASLLERDGAVVAATVDDPAELPFACPDRHPHVAVVAPGRDFAGSLRVLTRSMPRTRIVVLLRERSHAQVDAALKLGTDAAVLESDAPFVLSTVVRAVTLGQASIPRDMRAALRDQLPLSAREQNVLECVRDGLSVADTAARLGLSERTVRQHSATALAKLAAEIPAAPARRARARRAMTTTTSGHDARPAHGGQT